MDTREPTPPIVDLSTLAHNIDTLVEWITRIHTILFSGASTSNLRTSVDEFQEFLLRRRARNEFRGSAVYPSTLNTFYLTVAASISYLSGVAKLAKDYEASDAREWANRLAVMRRLEGIVRTERDRLIDKD